MRGVNIAKGFDVTIAEIDRLPGADPGPEIGKT